MPATKNPYKFKLWIKKSKDGQFFGVIKGRNGEPVYKQENCHNKQDVIDTANNLFPGCIIVDKTVKAIKA